MGKRYVGWDEGETLKPLDSDGVEQVQRMSCLLQLAPNITNRNNFFNMGGYNTTVRWGT